MLRPSTPVVRYVWTLFPRDIPDSVNCEIEAECPKEKCREVGQGSHESAQLKSVTSKHLKNADNECLPALVSLKLECVDPGLMNDSEVGREFCGLRLIQHVVQELLEMVLCSWQCGQKCPRGKTPRLLRQLVLVERLLRFLNKLRQYWPRGLVGFLRSVEFASANPRCLP